MRKRTIFHSKQSQTADAITRQMNLFKNDKMLGCEKNTGKRLERHKTMLVTTKSDCVLVKAVGLQRK